MKNWNAAEIVELNINETAQNVFGTQYDGGYVGDGHVGILEFPSNNNNNNNNNNNEEEFTS